MFKTVTDALPAKVFTEDLRVYGHLHLPPHVGTVDLLNNNARPFLPLTEASIYSNHGVEPARDSEPNLCSDFMAIPKERILWMAGGRHRDRQTMSGAESRRVYLFYPDYFLQGELKMTPDGRLSDFLSGSKLFQMLFDVELGIPDPRKILLEIEPRERFEFVVFNTRKLGGICDVSQDRDVNLTQF